MYGHIPPHHIACHILRRIPWPAHDCHHFKYVILYISRSIICYEKQIISVKEPEEKAPARCAFSSAAPPCPKVLAQFQTGCPSHNSLAPRSLRDMATCRNGHVFPCLTGHARYVWRGPNKNGAGCRTTDAIIMGQARTRLTFQGSRDRDYFCGGGGGSIRAWSWSCRASILS